MNILIQHLSEQEINAALIRLTKTFKSEQAALEGKVGQIINNTVNAKYDDSNLKLLINNIKTELTKKVNDLEDDVANNSNRINNLSNLLNNINVSYDFNSNTLSFRNSAGSTTSFPLKDTTYTFSYDTTNNALDITNDLDSSDTVHIPLGYRYGFSWNNGVLTITETRDGSTSTIATYNLDNRYYTENEIDGLLAQINAEIENINELIPPQATPQNQLADKNFVNSSIETNTATFRGTFDSLQDLEDYSGEKDNNDYAFVKTLDPVSGLYQYDRYKYDGTQWVYEYTINSSGFTAEQLAALNSGITDTLVAKITDVYNPTITINQNGSLVGTFTLNQSSNKTLNLANNLVQHLPLNTSNARPILFASASITCNACCCVYYSGGIPFTYNANNGYLTIGDSSNACCCYTVIAPHSIIRNTKLGVANYAFFLQKEKNRTDNCSLGMQIGTGNVNRGIYDCDGGVFRWLLYWNATDAIFTTPVTFQSPVTGTISNSTCFNGYTYSQAYDDIRSGLTSCLGTVTGVTLNGYDFTVDNNGNAEGNITPSLALSSNNLTVSLGDKTSTAVSLASYVNDHKVTYKGICTSVYRNIMQLAGLESPNDCICYGYYSCRCPLQFNACTGFLCAGTLCYGDNITQCRFTTSTNTNTSGWPVIRLLFDVTDWYNSPGTSASNVSGRGINGNFKTYRCSGYAAVVDTDVFMYANYGRGTSASWYTDLLRFRLEYNNRAQNNVIPVLLNDTVNDKYWLALCFRSYNAIPYRFDGISHSSAWSSTWLCTTSSGGALPTGWTLVREGTKTSTEYFDVYCGTTCQCSVYTNGGTLTLSANAFNENAKISTATYPGACCTGTLVPSDLTPYQTITDADSKYVFKCTLTYPSNTRRYVQIKTSATRSNQGVTFRINNFGMDATLNLDGTVQYYCGNCYGGLQYSKVAYNCANSDCFWLTYSSYRSPIICSAQPFEVLQTTTTAPTGVTFSSFCDIVTAGVSGIQNIDFNGSSFAVSGGTATLDMNPEVYFDTSSQLFCIVLGNQESTKVDLSSLASDHLVYNCCAVCNIDRPLLLGNNNPTNNQISKVFYSGACAITYNPSTGRLCAPSIHADWLSYKRGGQASRTVRAYNSFTYTGCTRCTAMDIHDFLCCFAYCHSLQLGEQLNVKYTWANDNNNCICWGTSSKINLSGASVSIINNSYCSNIWNDACCVWSDFSVRVQTLNGYSYTFEVNKGGTNPHVVCCNNIYPSKARNADLFNGCTYSQAYDDIRSGLTDCTGTLTQISLNGVSSEVDSGDLTLTPSLTLNGNSLSVSLGNQTSNLVDLTGYVNDHKVTYTPQASSTKYPLIFSNVTSPTSGSTNNVGYSSGCVGYYQPNNGTLWTCVLRTLNPTVCTSTVAGIAGIIHSAGYSEYYRETPYLDFHHNYACADYSARIINSAAGRLDIMINNATGCTASTASKTFCFCNNGYLYGCVCGNLCGDAACFGGCTYAQACTDIRTGLLSEYVLNGETSTSGTLNIVPSLSYNATTRALTATLGNQTSDSITLPEGINCTGTLIPSDLNGYATEAWVNAKNYCTHDCLVKLSLLCSNTDRRILFSAQNDGCVCPVYASNGVPFVYNACCGCLKIGDFTCECCHHLLIRPNCGFVHYGPKGTQNNLGAVYLEGNCLDNCSIGVGIGSGNVDRGIFHYYKASETATSATFGWLQYWDAEKEIHTCQISGELYGDNKAQYSCSLTCAGGTKRYVLLCFDTSLNRTLNRQDADFEIDNYTTRYNYRIFYNNSTVSTCQIWQSMYSPTQTNPYGNLCFSALANGSSTCQFWVAYAGYRSPVIKSNRKVAVICETTTAPEGITFSEPTNANIFTNVYCGTTCKCTLQGPSSLCLSANAFNEYASISETDYPGINKIGTLTSITINCNGTSLGTVTTSGTFNICDQNVCYGRLTSSATSADRNILLMGNGYTEGECRPVWYSDACKITFNPRNGVLKVGRVCASSYPLKYQQTLNLSEQSADCFYPVTWLSSYTFETEIEIQSPSGSSSIAYNQNYIHFFERASGWNDMPKTLRVQTLSRHTASENVFGCIGYGTSSSQYSVIWLRGGRNYTVNANVALTVNTTDVTCGSSDGASTYTVGTSLCGGTNTRVDVFANATTNAGTYSNQSTYGCFYNRNGCRYILECEVDARGYTDCVGTVTGVTLNGTAFTGTGSLTGTLTPSLSYTAATRALTVTLGDQTSVAITLPEGIDCVGTLVASDLNGYATETWVTNKGYTTCTGTVTSVNVCLNGTNATAITSSGKMCLNLTPSLTLSSNNLTVTLGNKTSTAISLSDYVNDHLVNQSDSSNDADRPILLGCSTWASGSAHQVYRNNSFTYNPSTGTLTATYLNGLAKNATCFDGHTYSEAKEDILSETGWQLIGDFTGTITQNDYYMLLGSVNNTNPESCLKVVFESNNHKVNTYISLTGTDVTHGAWTWDIKNNSNDDMAINNLAISSGTDRSTLYLGLTDSCASGTVCMKVYSQVRDSNGFDVLSGTTSRYTTTDPTGASFTPILGRCYYGYTTFNNIYANRIDANVFATTSSLRCKCEVNKSEINALDLINKLNIVDYKYKNESKDDIKHIGIIADYTDELITGKDHDQMRLADTVGLLLKAVQELSKEIK